VTGAIRSWALSATHADLTGGGVPPVRPVVIDAAPQRISVDLERTAIVVVDMQNDFCTPGGWLDGIGVDTAAAAAAVGPLSRILPALRAADVPVIWVNWGNRPDLANSPPGVRHVYDADGNGGGIGDRSGRSDAVLTKGSWGAAVVDALPADPRDVFVDKYRMSGFVDTPLDSILRNRRIDTVFFAGVNADQCVLATLMDAANLGYDVVMVEGASATTSPTFCLDATVYNVRQCFGFTTSPSALLDALA